MDLNLNQQATPPTTNKKSQNRFAAFWKSDRAILMVCIGIAFVFWLFTKLSYVYRNTYSIHLRYEIPSNKVLAVPPPDNIEMDVEGSGWELLYLYFSGRKYLIDVDLSDNAPKTLNASTLKGKITRQLPENVKVLEIRPDVVELTPEALATKEIPIRLDNRIELSPQYIFKDSIYSEPQTVTVKGPASVIAGLKFWSTEPLIMQNVESNFKKKIPLKAHSNRNVSFFPAFLTVSGSVEQITEKKLEIDIEKRGAPDSILLVLLPKKVTISCIVGLSDYDLLTADQFNAVADFSKFNIYEQTEVRIELDEFPNYVRQIRIQPKKVDYIIRSSANSIGSGNDNLE